MKHSLKILIPIVLFLFITVFCAMAFSIGWQRGFTECSQIWDRQMEEHNLILKE